MGRLMALATDRHTAGLLTAHAAEWNVTVEAAGEEAAGRMPHDVEAVILGPVVEPLRAVRRISAVAPSVPVFTLAPGSRCREIEDALRFSLIGTEVQCLPLHDDRQLVERVGVGLKRRRRRLAHQETLAALNRRIAQEPRAPARRAALLGRLLEVAPVGVVLVDDDDVVQEINRVGRQLLGREGAPLVGTEIGGLFDPEPAGRVRALLRLLRQDASGQARDTLSLRRGEKDLHLEITAAALAPANAGPGSMLVLQDTSERVELVAKLREANRRKDEFLAMLGHELRNPLAPIRTAVELMKLKGASQVERERATIERQVKHLIQLVDDLLDVARITRGKIPLRSEPVEMAAVVADAVEMSGPLLDQRRHRLTVDVPAEGLVVHGDRRRLAQVLGNLLTNAAKYTDEGGRVEVRARAENGAAVVRVTDNGRGIAPSMLPRAFDLFVQEQQSIDRAQGGLGLGLPIARSLVELHGGTIGVRSTPGVGSEFVVRLPLAPTSRAPSRHAAPGPARPITAPRRRVLLVDDNVDAAAMLADTLRAIGYEVVVCHDSAQALELAPAFAPDAALLDIGLPVMDGYELVGRLRRLSELRATRFVALTGYGQDGDRARAERAGFHEHLVKPVTLESVRRAVEDGRPES